MLNDSVSTSNGHKNGQVADDYLHRHCGMKFEATFNQTDPLITNKDQFKWGKRPIKITAADGKVVFERKECEFPESWSDNACQVVASKYFYGTPGKEPCENSVDELVTRVVNTIADWGFKDGYFDRAEAWRFERELYSLCVGQYASFNSPVWFNVGLHDHYGVSSDSTGSRWDDEKKQAVPAEDGYKYPQASACFILGVDDNMDSILELAKTEGMLFRYGSGAGSDLSTIRSSKEFLTGGGKPSGPLSFMRIYDAVASVVKSGGKNRRAAKIQTLKCFHPDVVDFIECKQKEEKKAKALIAQGYEANYNGEAYSSVCFQNSNLSVRLSDDFLYAVENDLPWTTKAVTDGRDMETFQARDILRKIAENAWQCGDPGVQYEDTIQKWHTLPNTAPINSSNPCCFVGETLIKTSFGSLSIEYLASRDSEGGCPLPSVVSYDKEDKCTQWGEIVKAWKSGETTELVEVTIRSGEKFRCTPEHVWYVDGFHPCEAKDLMGHRVDFYLDSSSATQKELVVSVETLKLADPVPVYDIEVRDNHNFTITSENSLRGYFVSNSEYMSIDDSACNLSSLNLVKFLRADGTFDTDRYRAAARLMLTAQEILVSRCGYPTKKIAENAHRFRQLGLGYANLGCLLMRMGLPYDSDEGRHVAACLTSLLTAEAYRTSAEIAGIKGPFEGFEVNKDPMLNVLAMHAQAGDDLLRAGIPGRLDYAQSEAWTECSKLAQKYGVRNSQVTVIAPTGTIALMQDCDTTGIEPDLGLVKTKYLAGGGTMRIVNQSVKAALKNLGYYDAPVSDILEYIEQHGTVEGCKSIESKDLAVFDCSNPGTKGGRAIHHMGHVKMLSAVQPFVSGSISKTVNMPESATVQDISDTYLEGWKLGLKCIAIYRDNSKGSQPLQIGDTKEGEKTERIKVSTPKETPEEQLKRLMKALNPHASPSLIEGGMKYLPVPNKRERLPDTRESITHKFNIGGHEGYLTVGLFPDGRPGELFVTISKEGSTIAGLMDMIGVTVSLCLQYGVPLQVLVDKFSHTKFDPSGFTKEKDIPIASSIGDYVFRWLAMKFIPGYREANTPKREEKAVIAGDLCDGLAEREKQEEMSDRAMKKLTDRLHEVKISHPKPQTDAPICDVCGSLTVRSGTCYACRNCGSSMGCS